MTITGMSKEATQKEFQKQVAVFVKNNVDFLIAEVSFFACRI